MLRTIVMVLSNTYLLPLVETHKTTTTQNNNLNTEKTMLDKLFYSLKSLS